MKRNAQIVKILFSYPFTWLSWIIIAFMEWAFIQWFHPPSLITLAAVGAGLVMLVLWPIVFLRSNTFREIYNQLPYKADAQELEKTLKSCSAAFRKPAQECLLLLDKTRQEFQSQTFQTELDGIFQNLFDLSRNHAQLYTRVQNFGTAEQKQTMQHILQQQVASVKNSLTALKAFSGNLTLLDTHPEDHARMGSELRAINEELQNVIQEV